LCSSELTLGAAGRRWLSTPFSHSRAADDQRGRLPADQVNETADDSLEGISGGVPRPSRDELMAGRIMAAPIAPIYASMAGPLPVTIRSSQLRALLDRR
jgi:hypothetical protein